MGNIKIKTLAAIAKISPHFIDTPEGNLNKAVVVQAIKDLRDKSHSIRSSAAYYLSKDMYNAEICNVSSEWIRRVIQDVGINLDEFIGEGYVLS